MYLIKFNWAFMAFYHNIFFWYIIPILLLLSNLATKYMVLYYLFPQTHRSIDVSTKDCDRFSNALDSLVYTVLYERID